MATPTLSGGITNAANTINNADATTNWSAFGAQTSISGTDADIKVEGTAAVAYTFHGDASGGIYTNGTNINLTGQHLRGWINTTTIGQLDFMELRANDAYWTVFKGPATTTDPAGVSTYRGGYRYVVLDYDSTPTTGTKDTSPNIFGFRFQRVAAPANRTNTYIDVFRYGDGYTATGGTSGDPITFTTISDVDILDAYGIVQNVNDTNFLYGAVQIGNGATATYLESKNEAIVFVDAPVSSTLYNITATGSGCTFDAENTLFKANGAQTFSFDVQNVNTLMCDGNSFIQASSITFGSGQTINSCVFVDCGNTTTNGATISRGSFTDCSPVAVNNLSELDRCTFIRTTGTEHAVVLANTGETTSMNWSCDASAGYAVGSLGSFSSGNASSSSAAIHYTGSSDLTINVLTTGTTPSIRVSNVANPTVTLAAPPAKFILTGLKPKTEVRLISASSNFTTKGVEIAGVESVSAAEAVGINNGTLYSGNITVSSDVIATESKFTYEYQYPGSDVNMLVAILSSSTYEVLYLETSLTSEGRNIPVQQQIDRNSNL